MQLTLAFIFATCGFVACQNTDGCPMYGCSPGGTFSFQLNVPHTNATVHWISDFFIGPVPDAQGCVGNSVQLVCQSNGPAGDDTGYMSISLSNGAVNWRDPILRFPALPLLNVSGDVIGSDGHSLVHYDKNGRLLSSVVKLEPDMQPIYSLHLIGSDLVLFVSESGLIALRALDGRPVTELLLNGTVERANGTFIPVASPVSNGNRFYLLTEFVPYLGQVDSFAVLGLQRLYAIDVFDRMADRVEIAWYANFEREGNTEDATKLKFRSQFPNRRFPQRLKRHRELIKPSLMWHSEANMVFVSLPVPELYSKSNGSPTFWGIKDSGSDAVFVFRSDRAVTNMALFEPPIPSKQASDMPFDNAVRFYSKIGLNDVSLRGLSDKGKQTTRDQMSMDIQNVPNAGAQLWVTLDDGKVCAVQRDGNISKIIDLPDLLKADFKITSKMSIARNRQFEEDFLIFGIRVQNSTSEFRNFLLTQGITYTNATAFLMAIDTPENAEDFQQPVMWMVPTPNNTTVIGQIVGVKRGDGRPDELIYFALSEDKFAKIVSIV